MRRASARIATEFIRLEGTIHVSAYDKPDPKRGPFPNAEEPMRFGKFNPKSRKPLAKLVSSVPQLAMKLAQDEMEQAKQELTSKAIKGGTGAALFGVVAFFGLTLWAVLITFAILGLNSWFAPWLSALIVAGALLVLMIIAAIVAIVMFKKMQGIKPERTLESVRQDLNAVKGLGRYE
ncbi:phage holin family protein [Gulosibacter bifidus]|uniref:Phage holin family protein n=1 Tax=Gulosibacter bifidus TaxID=272239 RepID=A0ABW5RJB2_9MICO|nr:phage holin family protein [Gulosibacter bifidus]